MSAGYNETATARLPVCDTLNYGSVNATTANTIGIDMSHFRRAWYALEVDSVSSGVINCQLQSSTLANFATVHNYSSSALNSLNTNNQWQTFEIRAEQIIQANPGDRYVRLNLSLTGVATFSVLGLGIDAIQSPGSQYNLNSTYLGNQIVT